MAVSAIHEQSSAKSDVYFFKLDGKVLDVLLLLIDLPCASVGLSV